MKKMICAILLAILVFSVPSTAIAAEGVQRITYIEGYEPIYSVDVDNRIWNVELDNGDIVGVSEDGMMWFFMGDVKDAKDLKEAVVRTREDIGKYLTDIRVTKAIDEFTMNGLLAHSYEATAKANGKDVIIFVMLFRVETGEIGLLLFVMDPLAEELYLQRLMDMTRSISRR